VILIDTSVIVAWLDRSHPLHIVSTEAIELWASKGPLTVSVVTHAELAAGGRTRDAIDEDLRFFEIIPLSADAACRAGMAFRRYRRKDGDDPALPDFLIRAQAAVLNLVHLTNDRRRTKCFPDVDFYYA
jgi:predicted nucleic acid-binding protein